MAIEGGKVKKKSEKKRYFDTPLPEETTPAQPDTGAKKATKIVFNDDGEQSVVPIDTDSKPDAHGDGQEKAQSKGGKRKHQKGSRSASSLAAGEDGETMKRWYEHYEHFNIQGELVELKDAEISELRKVCRAAFDVEVRRRLKDDPSDGKWLQSAMEKGTSRDRASSGALLVQTNPFCNLSALETVIGMVKTSNKGHLDVVDVLTELMLNSLMPQYRKLIPLHLRGADWKSIQKQDINKELREMVYAHWHFEEQLREQYFSFVTNLSTVLHSGQEDSKCKTIVYASKLFRLVPEKEAFLLTMLVNKLGDPSKKVAVKALYHLQSVVQQHSAMAFVVTSETEKLLFRNNVSAAAQHYALSFMSTISVYGDQATCQKMVNVCFAFFKILTEKGEINSRTMQSILACLRKSIANIKRDVPLAEIVKPELLNVIYRMIHLANITIACQGLSLLLEVSETKGREQNRFYNALYRKLLDAQLASVGSRISNVLFYILHRAVQNDPLPERAQAFIKRLLQVSFYFPPSRVCAVLIVISKVLRKRKNLAQDGQSPDAEVQVVEQTQTKKGPRKGGKADGHVKSENTQEPNGAGPERRPKRYDAFHRTSEYAGANYTMKYELTRYLDYFHPTVQKFAECIINNAPLTYYGDPLRDFSLGHFLERFSFKNPKKPKAVDPGELAPRRPLGVGQKKGDYVPAGSRALPVESLTKDKCTEDDQFIFQFLEKKRERLQRVAEKKKARDKRKKGKTGDEDDEDDDDEEIDSDVDSLDDDEFDAYLDRLGVPGGQDGGANMDAEELDFMHELEKDMSAEKKKDGKKKKTTDDDDDTLDDWDDVGDGEDAAENDEDIGDEEDEFSDGGSVSLDGDEDVDDEELERDDADFDDEDDDDDDDGPVVKKRKKSTFVNDRAFARKLKSTDVNSLFAAADDFSQLLEESVDGGSSAKEGTSKKRKQGLAAFAHGTDTEVFNQDKSSLKQLAWEQQRFSGNATRKYGGGGGGMRKQFGGKKFAGGKKHMPGGGKPKFGGGKGKPKHRK